MSDDIKPSDFFSIPSTDTVVPKIPFAIMVACTENYFRHRKGILAKRDKNVEPTELEMMADALMYDQMMMSIIAMYSQVNPEDRRALVKFARTIDTEDVPTIPNMEELF